MLIIFDIDGTLCDTHDVDARCFADAILAVTGRSLESLDWSRYSEATGSAIVRGFLADCGTTDFVGAESRILSDFISRLELQARAHPEEFRPIEGALDLFHELKNHCDHKLALATGCGTTSAQFKLRQAGFDASQVPFASSSDTPRRANIIRLTVHRAGFELRNAIYVGDGPWDLKATQELGMGFIGIGRRHKVLFDLGAVASFSSFNDKAAFMRSLDADRLIATTRPPQT